MPSTLTPHEQCQHAVAEFVRGLALAELPPERVYEHLTSSGANITYPCVLVSIAGLIEESERIAFDTWQWTYPVLVQMLRRGDPKDPGEQGPYLLWRDAITTALEETMALPGIDGFVDVEVRAGGNVTGSARGRTEPGQTADPLGPAWLKVAGSLTARVQLVVEG